MKTKVKKGSGEPQELSVRQYVAISLLITGTTQAAVAKKLEVSEKTVSKWCNGGLFRKVLAEQKNRILNDTVNIMVQDVTQQKDLIQKAVLKNVESITSKINTKTTAIEHKAIAEVLDKSLVSLELAPRFNNKIELDNNHRGYSPEVLTEMKRVDKDMEVLNAQITAAAKAMEIMSQPDKEQKEGLENIMEV